MKIIKSLEESGLLIKEISETIQCRFLPMLLGTLAASILGNALSGQGVIRSGEGKFRAGQNVSCHLIF